MLAIVSSPIFIWVCIVVETNLSERANALASCRTDASVVVSSVVICLVVVAIAFILRINRKSLDLTLQYSADSYWEEIKKSNP